MKIPQSEHGLYIGQTLDHCLDRPSATFKVFFVVFSLCGTVDRKVKNNAKSYFAILLSMKYCVTFDYQKVGNCKGGGAC